ncbi:Ras guanyl-releasing protein 3 [Orchesella cincta]|uniref:Ras guanyl-releasing protein 3 n=1 Tax=Orchesella cincta TaxID=48709 RepID=A0A1D2N5S0_ORCCI|nr:Ras guanyl-releasing protein 3 [Orchesella cincta]
MFPLHFDVDDQLNKIVRKFSAQLEGEGRLEWANWLDLSEIPSYDWLRNNSVSKEPEAPRPNRKVSLIFNHLEPHELAHHVTYLEHKIMRRITFHDFKTYAENGTLADNPVLERSVSIFNGLSQWIQFVVLNRPTPQQRADVIAKFVHVAKKLKEIQNFNSLMGVVGSLSHSALARLSKTMECIPAEEKKVLSELAALVSSSNNFRQYRRALSQSVGFRIPIL